MKINVKLTRSENISYYHKNQIEIDIEEYLKGVVPAEIGNAALEACKAQAVAARTFALNKFKKQGYITDKSSIDQAFRASRFASSYSRAHQGVMDTAGEILYYKGALVTGAYFCHSNGGRTYSSKEVWGGNRPYLIARADPWDKGTKSGHGIGLSQTGAKAAAAAGKSYKEILNFYYPGTEITKEEEEKKQETVVIKPMGITNTDFVTYLKQMVGQPYWYGTCGYNCTFSLLKAKARQYPSHYGSSRSARYNRDIAAKQVCADCIGLGKGFVWSSGGGAILAAIGTGTKIVNKYGSGGCPDKSANGMFAYAKAKKLKYGPIATIPEIPGLAVRKDGHVGYYIGDGKVVEAQSFAKGIIITNLKDRPWTDWYEFPGIKYIIEDPKPVPTLTRNTLRFGSKGEDVKVLQQKLKDLGYDIGRTGIDGKFGLRTAAAVKAFQKDKKLKVDGIVGKATWTALG